MSQSMAATVAIDEASWPSLKSLWDFSNQTPGHLSQKVCFHLPQHSGSRQGHLPQTLCHSASVVLSQGQGILSRAFLPPTNAGSSQHLSLSAQESLHTICNIWSWNCETGEGQVIQAEPTHPMRQGPDSLWLSCFVAPWPWLASLV